MRRRSKSSKKRMIESSSNSSNKEGGYLSETDEYEYENDDIQTIYGNTKEKSTSLSLPSVLDTSITGDTSITDGADVEEDGRRYIFSIDASSLPQVLLQRIQPSESRVITIVFCIYDDSVYVRAPKGLRALLEQITQRHVTEALNRPALPIAQEFQSSQNEAHPMTVWTEKPFSVFDRIRSDFFSLCYCCPVCRVIHEEAVLNIVPCSSENCIEQFAELGLGRDVSVEIRNQQPEVIDLLVCLTVWAALPPADRIPNFHRYSIGDFRAFHFNPFPRRFVDQGIRQYEALLDAIDRIPSIEVLKDLVDTNSLQSFFGHDAYMREAFYLLNWIINSNRATFEFVPKHARTQFEMDLAGDMHLFRVINPPEKEASFRDHLRGGRQTEWLYHGSGAGNWHSIVRNSLMVCSGTPMQRHGASAGAGIYLGMRADVSKGYTTFSSSSWAQSSLDSSWALLVAENVIIPDSHSTERTKPMRGSIATSQFFNPLINWNTQQNTQPGRYRLVSDASAIINRYLLTGNLKQFQTVL